MTEAYTPSTTTLDERQMHARLRIGDALLDAAHLTAKQLEREGYTPQETLQATYVARSTQLATIAMTVSRLTGKPIEHVRADIIADFDANIAFIKQKIGS